MWMQNLVVAILLPHLSSSTFQCPGDGHFKKDGSCTSYYYCVYGNPIAMSCPSGLLWNSVSNQCDHPTNVDCQEDLGGGLERIEGNKQPRYSKSIPNGRSLQEPNGKFIYMTFDDGPNEGSSFVLDALKEVGVKATFFINSLYLHDKSPKFVARNRDIIFRMVNEGHVIGDHSYDHMAHNTKPRGSPNNAYTGLESDLLWFGQKNIDPVTLALKEANYDGAVINSVMNMMWYNIRLPFSNNWRVGDVAHDCYPCTVPASSGRNGVELAKALHEEGANVFGWDLEWNWGAKGDDMFSRLDTTEGKLPGKVVVLSHDLQHKPGGDLELVKFLSMAVDQGYTFRTVDTYLTDF